MKNRRTFIRSSIALTAGAIGARALTSCDNPKEAPKALPSLSGKKVLFSYGGWPGHAPEKWRDFMVPWLEENDAEVVQTNTLDTYTDRPLMQSIDLVIQVNTMSEITPVQEKGLLEAIRINGTGMAGWHGGMGDSFRNSTEYQFMTGGQFVAHPGGVVDYVVNILNREDSITVGLSDFQLSDEQYYMHVDPNVKVLATTEFSGEHCDWIDGCTMPVAWKKMYGKGRVFYASFGHALEFLGKASDSIEIIKRGIRWASGSKYEPAEKWIEPVHL